MDKFIIIVENKMRIVIIKFIRGNIMSYINFKEEISVANNQLSKRRENNKKLYDDMFKDKSKASKFQIDNQYSFKTISNILFGEKGVKKEDEFIEIANRDIICCKFIECKFYNVKFKDCKFIGCLFDKCDFAGGGVVFEGCCFLKKESEEIPSLNCTDNFSTEFRKSYLYCKFLDCNLGFAIFDNDELSNICFENDNLNGVIIKDNTIDGIKFQDSNMRGFKTINTYIKDLDFLDEGKSSFDEKTFFDKIQLIEKTRDEYEGIYHVYETLADKFKENNLNNNFGEYYYLCRSVQRKTLKPIPRILSYISWFSCGYGERPENAAISSLVIIIIFSLLFLILGLDVDGEIVKYTISNIKNLSFSKFWGDLKIAFDSSVGAFTGVGYNAGEPLENTYFLGDIEMLLGVIMMGIGIGTITRKIVR